MMPRIACRIGPIALLLTVAAVPATGCKTSQLSADGTKVAILYDEPVGCENLGVVVGRGGGLGGAYSKPSVNQEAAENDALNQAAELGATHLVLHPEEIQQGDGRGPDYQDTQPALAHGSGTGSTVNVSGVAYKCALAAPETKSAMSIRSGGAFVEVKAPTGISLAPLGKLQSIHVYRRTPLASGTDVSEDEILVVEDDAKIRDVAGSLRQVVEDPMKYIPTHRVELIGELGSQSLLYGFGYLQYAGKVYRLTDGVFEEALQLREPSKSPEVESEPPAPGSPPAEESN
jgi:hypothetical protein